MPLVMSGGQDNCESGESGVDCALEHGLSFLVSGDQFLKGAANAVQIAEHSERLSRCVSAYTIRPRIAGAAFLKNHFIVIGDLEREKPACCCFLPLSLPLPCWPCAPASVGIRAERFAPCWRLGRRVLSSCLGPADLPRFPGAGAFRSTVQAAGLCFFYPPCPAEVSAWLAWRLARVDLARP